MRTKARCMSHLFYVIGASGAGKDALMQAARQHLAGKSILFAHRYITRSHSDASENFVQLNEAEFRKRQSLALFWLSWQAHGLSYALGTEVLHWLHLGLPVVINGSREALPQVRVACQQAHVQLHIVWVHCAPEVLAQRLRLRARESEAEIQERLALAQAYQVPNDALVVDNSGALSQTLAQWLPVLMAVIPHE